MKVFNYINNDIEKKTAKYLATIQTDEEGNDFFELYTKQKYLIIYDISKGKIKDTQNQIEIPYSSLKWIKDSIINGFWKKPSEGGLPKNKHACIATFNNEDILISRSMNAGYPGKMGFNILNKSRPCHILPSWYQEVQITDDVMKSYLLPIIEKLTSKPN